MPMTDTPDQQEPPKSRPLIDLLVSIIIPSVILMKLSAPEQLGATKALLLALAFPAGWGLYQLISEKKKNWIALLGVISVLLTGGIGLLKLDAGWLAIKEAAVPSVIGLGILIAHKLGYPAIKKLLYNPSVFEVQKIEVALDERGTRSQFQKRLDMANYLLAGTFGFSAVMNYLLAKWIVKSDSGTAAFNEELGRMTLLSYPVIAIPSTIMMLGIFWFLWRTLKVQTGLSFEQIMAVKD